MPTNTEIRSKIVFALLLVAGLALSACPNEGPRACADDSACFVGEVCIDTLCLLDEGTREDAGGDQDATTGPGTPDAGDVGGAGGDTCEVSRFEATCDGDPFEPNDNNRTPALVGPNAANGPMEGWCDPGYLGTPQVYQARLCAGDRDVYRVFVDNRSPTTCIDGSARITVTVDLGAPCDRSLFTIFPFWNDGQNICESDDRVQCKWSADNRQFEMIWVLENEQIFNTYFDIATTELDFKLDYTISVTVEGI